MTECYSNSLHFPPVKRRRVEADFTGGEITGNGGVPLLARVDGLLGLTRAGPAFLAPGLAILGQVALHVVYGDEYILYSPNWHGLVVAVTIASAWNAFPRLHRVTSLLGLLLAVGMLVNNVAVLRRSFADLRHGMALELRDEAGQPLPPVTPGSRAP